MEHADGLPQPQRGQAVLTIALGIIMAVVDSAIANVASIRGAIGAGINRLQSAVNVINNQVQNLTAAEDGIRAADIAQEVANLTKFSILNQTGISALAQANGWIFIKPDSEGYPAGSEVVVRPWP